MTQPCPYCGVRESAPKFSAKGYRLNQHHRSCEDMKLISFIDAKVKDMRCFRHVALLLTIIANRKAP